MKDEADLIEKYWHKPDQLASIMQNADQFYCPIRNCILYADPDDFTESNFIQEDNTETDETARPTKKLKTEAAPPVPGELKALKSGRPPLKELFDICEAVVNKYVASHEIANNHIYTDYIGAKVISTMNAKKTELLEKKSEIMSHFLDSANSRYSSKDIRKMICELRKRAKYEHDDVERRLAIARSDIAATCLTGILQHWVVRTAHNTMASALRSMSAGALGVRTMHSSTLV